MAVILIPNQLVKLYDTETLNQRNKRLTLDYRTYCQIVREEQTTMFQVRLTPDQENLIVNGDFETNDFTGWSSFGTWSVVDGRARVNLNGVTASFYQIVTVVTGRTYKLRFTVDFEETTNVLLVKIGTTEQIFTAENYGLEPFTVEMSHTADSVSLQITFIATEAPSGTFYIDEITLERLSEPTVTLENCNDALIETLTPYARASDVITYAVNWFGKPEDCYRICIDGIDDTDKNYLDLALALGTEGGSPIELEQGGFLKWFG